MSNARLVGVMIAGVAAILVGVMVAGGSLAPSPASQPADAASYVVNDSHFHLTNYVQEGTPVREFVKIMGNKVGRSTLPTDQQKYLKVYDMYAPLLAALPADVSLKFRRTNYEWIFDEAKRKVRAWEKAHVPVS